MHRPLLRSVSLVLAAGLAVTLAAACDVYDESLLGGGGAGQGGSSTSQGGGGGEPPVGCTSPSECPGEDNECGTRTCVDGFCGVDAAQAGTPVTQQTAGDCIRLICDGDGVIVGEPDDADAPDDGNPCTTDACSGGLATHTPRALGSLCTGTGGAKVCNADAECVVCVVGSDCPDNICTESFTCAPGSCGDTVKNGLETDIDCGGSLCPKCAIDRDCGVASDCLSNACVGGKCQPSCFDGIKNQNESDVDCGGVCSAKCAFGLECNLGSDCDTGTCTAAGRCGCAIINGQVLISELRTRGPAGGNDEFVELYNPGSATVDISGWVLEARTGTGSYTVKFTAPAGTTIGPRRHFLIANTNPTGGYSGATTPDGTYTAGIVDRSAVVLKTGATVVDAVCFQGPNCGSAPVFGVDDPCEGEPFVKTLCNQNVNQSMERRPGGSLGNCVDSENNATDFVEVTPSNPQNLSSPATP